MDWKVFTATFLTIFLAELGDKTQLGILGFSAQNKQPVTIFVAACLALILSTLIAVLAGTILAKYINPKILRLCGGLLFIAIGIWILIDLKFKTS